MPTIAATNLATITAAEAAALIANLKHNEEGGFFSVKFIKRTNGEIRDMVCKVDVKKYLRGGEPAYDFLEKNLVCVCDMTIAKTIQEHTKAGTLASLDAKLRNPYRSINLSAILEIRAGGVHYKVK